MASTMESGQVPATKQLTSCLPKVLMITGVALTILTTAIFATYFFGHYIPITDVQQFLGKIHHIPNMTWYVTAGGSVLGAAAIASMISSVVLNRKSSTENKIKKIVRPSTNNDKSNENYRLAIVEYLKNNAKENIEKRLGKELPNYKFDENLFKKDLEKCRIQIILNGKDSTSGEIQKLPGLIKLACCQTIKQDLWVNALLASFTDKNVSLILEQNTNKEKYEITKINYNTYNIEYPFEIKEFSDFTHVTQINPPIKFKISFDLVKENDDKWKCKNVLVLIFDEKFKPLQTSILTELKNIKPENFKSFKSAGNKPLLETAVVSNYKNSTDKATDIENLLKKDLSRQTIYFVSGYKKEDNICIIFDSQKNITEEVNDFIKKLNKLNLDLEVKLAFTQTYESMIMGAINSILWPELVKYITNGIISSVSNKTTIVEIEKTKNYKVKYSNKIAINTFEKAAQLNIDVADTDFTFDLIKENDQWTVKNENLKITKEYDCFVTYKKSKVANYSLKTNDGKQEV